MLIIFYNIHTTVLIKVYSHTLIERVKNYNLSISSCLSNIFDNFTGQNIEQVLKHLENNYVYFIQVPANCTDRLQLLIISVNKAVKDFQKENLIYIVGMMTKFVIHQKQKWVIEGILWTLRLSVVKPLSAHWMIKIFDYLRSRLKLFKI